MVQVLYKVIFMNDCYKILSLTVIIFSSMCAPAAFGHGLGLETIPSVVVGDKEISITVEIPSYYDETNERQVIVTATDKQTKETVPNVTYLIGLYRGGDMIFRNYFFTDDGKLSITVKSAVSDETIQIHGKQKSFLDAWYGTSEDPLEITGPVFESSGLYTFEIEIRTIDDPTNIVEDLGVHNADITIVGVSEFVERDAADNDVQFRVKSYFDTVDSFRYDPINKVVTFEMPFDWSEKQIFHIPVVHTEVHFPKDFAEFLTPGYYGKVNGVKLFKSSVSVDDYTEDSERIVHFVLLTDNIKYVKNQLKQSDDSIGDKMIFTLETNPDVNFPVSAWTRDESFQVDLYWDPLEISPDQTTRFIFTIRDAATAEPLRNSNFDFVILQNDKQIHRESKNAQIGGGFIDYTFTEDQGGPTVIRFENIRGTGLSTEFGIVVSPEFGLISLLILTVGMTFVILSGRKYFLHNY